MSARPKTSCRKVSESYNKTFRKGYLVKMLREKGFSKRKAVAAVNAVFDLMTRALWRGENVDIPVGSIHAESPPAGRKGRWQKFCNIQTKNPFHRIVPPPKRTIRFRVDRRLILSGPDALPPLPPERQGKQEELEQLYLQLMGRQITLPDLRVLLNAAVDDNKPDSDPNLPENFDRLVARLRQLVKDQCRVANLPSEVRQLHWIR